MFLPGENDNISNIPCWRTRCFSWRLLYMHV